MVTRPPLQNMTDPGGNKVAVFHGKVYLILKDSDRRLHIGTINDEHREFVVRRNREKHLYRASNSYGFNYFVIKNTVRFDKVRLIDEYGQYLVPVESILENGKILHHQKSGQELQIFVPLGIIEYYNINKDSTSNKVYNDVQKALSIVREINKNEDK